MRTYSVATTGGTPFDKWIQKAAVQVRKKLQHKKYRTPDAIDNLERLHRLRERGAINDTDFEELQEKLKAQI